MAQAPQTAVSGYIQGSINIDATSSFVVFGSIFFPLYIIGDVNGSNRIVFGDVKATAFAPFPLDIQGTATPPVGIPPVITSANSTTFTVGTAGSFTVTTTGFPTPTLTETGTLPSGVTFVDNGNGTATLRAPRRQAPPAPTSLTITAANSVTPSATQSFTLTVDQAPAITSGQQYHLNGGHAGTFTVTTTGFPTPTLTAVTGYPHGRDVRGQRQRDRHYSRATVGHLGRTATSLDEPQLPPTA